MTLDPPSSLRVSHLGDATVVTVRPGFDVEALVALARTELTGPARLVLDFQEPAAGTGSPQGLVEQVTAALEPSARLDVVERDAAIRELWGRSGRVAAHESLDDALADEAPVLRTPQDAAAEHLAPAAGDATLVAADDVSGNPTAL